LLSLRELAFMTCQLYLENRQRKLKQNTELLKLPLVNGKALN